jgi:hypothetical protein
MNELNSHKFHFRFHVHLLSFFLFLSKHYLKEWMMSSSYDTRENDPVAPPNDVSILSTICRVCDRDSQLFEEASPSSAKEKGGERKRDERKRTIP